MSLSSKLESFKASTINTGVVVAIAVILLIAGFAAGYLVARREATSKS